MMKNMSLASFSRQFPPVRSSKSLGWQGIEAVRRLLPPDDVCVEQRLSSHLLVLYLGTPSLLAQVSFSCVYDTLAETFVRKGAHAFVPAERQVGGRWQTDVDALFLQFDPALMRSIIEASDMEANRVELLVHPFSHDHVIEHIGLALLHEIHSSGLNTRLYAESLASALTLHVLRQCSTLQHREPRVPSTLSRTRLSHVLDYMQEYYTRDLSVAELAAVAQVSPSHFAQLFRTTMEMAPHEYLIACRIEHAKRLLLTQESPLNEVAYSCGFADQSHMTRHFRRIMGVTPGVFRKEY